MSVEKLQSFFAGVITGIKPDLLPPFASPSGQNAVIDRIAEQQGRVRRRKGAVPLTCAPVTNSPEILGIFHYPGTDGEQILVIGNDGSLNVEGANEFICPPPEIITPAERSMLKFFTLTATASTIAGLTSMATPSSARWSARNQSAAITDIGDPPLPWCVGGVFGTQFEEAGVIEDYFPGTKHSHNLSDENTVEVAAGIGTSSSYGVRVVSPAGSGWVKWVPATPYETEAIGWSIEHAFDATTLASLGSPSTLHAILEAEYGGNDIEIGLGPGLDSGYSLYISFMDDTNYYYSTRSETDVAITPGTFYTISVNVVYSSKVGGVVQADGSVQVSVDGVLAVEAQNVKIESQLKHDSGGNNRIPAIYFAVMDKIDDICISPLT